MELTSNTPIKTMIEMILSVGADEICNKTNCDNINCCDYCNLRKAENSLRDIVNAPIVTIKKVIYNNPATIVLWSDYTKTIAMCDKKDTYNEIIGFLICCLRKFLGNKKFHDLMSRFYNIKSS